MLSPQGFPSRTHQASLTTPASSTTPPGGGAALAPTGSGSAPVLPLQGVNLLPSLGGATAAVDEMHDEMSVNGINLVDHDRLSAPVTRREDISSGMCVIFLSYKLTSDLW